ncbi:multidrug effflux MFS transporter [Rubrivivax albus]|nr:multidrug effflux MFS transporter [Rubrivivax albus]
MTAPSTATTGSRPALGHGGAAAVLALLMGLQPATTDIYLPALPLLTQDLAAPMALAQLTMAALILAFGFGQLLWGPVADRFGRRPVLVGTLAAYALAALGSVLAGSIEQLVAWRALQGFTMAGAVVCSRAMVRDLYAPIEGAQVMALALSGLGIVALLGPALGGLVAATSGWRAALGVVAAYGAAAFALVAWRVPETLAQKNPRATAPGPMLANWVEVARHPGFRAWMLLVTCTYGGIFTYLAGSSFVFIDVLGLSPAQYGLAMASVSACYMAGTFACRPWIRRFGLGGSVVRAAGFTAVAGASIVLLAVAGVESVWALLVPQWIYCFGHGFHMPCGQAGTVAPFPHKAGAASALAGFVMALVAFGIGRWLGVALDGTVLPFAFGLGFWSATTCAVAWTLVRRHGG